eukprot:jgi/Psemu1/292509/fgenesh1_pg.1100_\
MSESTAEQPPPPPNSSSNSNKIIDNDNDKNDCSSIVKKRGDCYRKHQLGGDPDDIAAITTNQHASNKFQKCWIPTLRAKRCLAFSLCAREALDYYQTPSDAIVEGVNGPRDKGYCAAYDEAYCFGNPRIMKIDLESARHQKHQKHRQETFEHHERWKRRVVNSKPKQGRCEQMRDRLHRCLSEHGV